MPHHVHVTLPDGLEVSADWREGVVQPMRRYLIMSAEGRVRPSDIGEIRAWWELNAEQSRLCRDHLCDHRD